MAVTIQIVLDSALRLGCGSGMLAIIALKHGGTLLHSGTLNDQVTDIASASSLDHCFSVVSHDGGAMTSVGCDEGS